MSAIRLHIGRRWTRIEIRPDRRVAKMWRIVWPGGELSPMGNLTRAKDAARAFAHPSGGKIAHWHRRQIEPEASPAALLSSASIGSRDKHVATAL